MAITPLRLDGQTIGFQTTGADPISVLSLNISTGAVTSAYLTDTDILNLAPAVTELFALVPSVSRAANALGMLQRLITVASAGSATVALTATNVGSVYTLVATPSAASFLIAHLPFAPDGNLAWATGTGGSSLTLPLSTANGGTGINGSASNGVFGVGGGVGGVTPLVYAAVTAGGASPNLTLEYQLRNGTVNFTTANVLIWGQIAGSMGPAAFDTITLSIAGGGEGQVFSMQDFSLTTAQIAAYGTVVQPVPPNGIVAPSGSGRFVMSTGVNGKVNLQVNCTTPGAQILVLYGPGPGTNNLLIGGENSLNF